MADTNAELGNGAVRSAAMFSVLNVSKLRVVDTCCVIRELLLLLKVDDCDAAELNSCWCCSCCCMNAVVDVDEEQDWLWLLENECWSCWTMSWCVDTE